jgi:hypothetical protein
MTSMSFFGAVPVLDELGRQHTSTPHRSITVV